MTISIATADLVLGSSVETIFSVGAGMQYVILKATVTNTDTSAHTVTVYRVSSGGTAGTSNILGADALSIPAGATVVLPISGQGLTAAQTLQALASVANVVNFNITLAQVVS